MDQKVATNKNILFLEFSWKLKKAYVKAFEKLAGKFKLTQNEIDVLLFLHNNAPLDTASDIAKYRAMSKSMISNSVTGLHKKGYLFYERDLADQRCVHLKIQPAAGAIVEELSKTQIEFFTNLSHNITLEEYGIMKSILNKMQQNINNQLRK